MPLDFEPLPLTDSTPRTYALIQNITVTPDGFIHTDENTRVIEYTGDVLSAMIRVNREPGLSLVLVETNTDA